VGPAAGASRQAGDRSRWRCQGKRPGLLERASEKLEAGRLVSNLPASPSGRHDGPLAAGKKRTPSAGIRRHEGGRWKEELERPQRVPGLERGRERGRQDSKRGAAEIPLLWPDPRARAAKVDEATKGLGRELARPHQGRCEGKRSTREDIGPEGWVGLKWTGVPVSRLLEGEGWPSWS